MSLGGNTREALDRAAQRVPNQKGSRLDQVDGLTVYNVDIETVAPDRHEPVVRPTEIGSGGAALGPAGSS